MIAKISTGVYTFGMVKYNHDKTIADKKGEIEGQLLGTNLINKNDFEYQSFLKEIEHRQLNETMNDFILKVFKNSATYTFVSSVLDGEKHFYKKKIKEATDYEVINNLLLDAKEPFAQSQRPPSVLFSDFFSDFVTIGSSFR